MAQTVPVPASASRPRRAMPQAPPGSRSLQQGADPLDVLIVGAGLSGHRRRLPPAAATARTRRYAILEGRDAIGGTWDLFRYPGVRSDSDMYTLGFRFRPWRDAKAIADGAVDPRLHPRDRREYGIDKHIRFRHRVCAPLVDRRRALDGARPSAPTTASRRRSPAASSISAAATTTTTTGYTPRLRRRRPVSRARSSIRSTGPRTSTTPASASS